MKLGNNEKKKEKRKKISQRRVQKKKERQRSPKSNKMETFPLHKKVKHYKTTQKPSTLEENKKQQLPKQTEPHVQVPT